MFIWILCKAELSGSENHCTKNEVFYSGFLQKMLPNPQETADLVIFTEEINNGKLHFLCSQ